MLTHTPSIIDTTVYRLPLHLHTPPHIHLHTLAHAHAPLAGCLPLGGRLGLLGALPRSAILIARPSTRLRVLGAILSQGTSSAGAIEPAARGLAGVAAAAVPESGLLSATKARVGGFPLSLRQGGIHPTHSGIVG